MCFAWLQMLKKICWLIVLSPSYSTAEGSSSDRLTLLNTTFQVRILLVSLALTSATTPIRSAPNSMCRCILPTVMSSMSTSFHPHDVPACIALVAESLSPAVLTLSTAHTGQEAV